MCNLYSLTKGQAAIRDLFRARYDRTGNTVSWNLPRSDGPYRSQHSRWRARACNGALGNAWTASVRRRAGHQHPQSDKPALARVARPAKPVPRAGDFVLRMRGHEASQDADVVCAE